MGFLNVSIDAKVATVTLANPPVNALSNALLEELSAALDRLKADPEVKALVLTGAGPVFVAGADIKEFTQLTTPEQGRKATAFGQSVFMKIERLEKPVIAAINGVCLGGGMELAMACHIRVCSDRAKLGQPEINLGIIPGYGGTQRMARLAGKAKAAEWILTGDNIAPPDAKAAGLVNHVVPEAEVLRVSQGMAKKIAMKPAVALAQALKALTLGGEAEDLDAGMKLESEMFARCCESPDLREGVASFLEKRQPKFTDK